MSIYKCVCVFTIFTMSMLTHSNYALFCIIVESQFQFKALFFNCSFRLLSVYIHFRSTTHSVTSTALQFLAHTGTLTSKPNESISKTGIFCSRSRVEMNLVSVFSENLHVRSIL